MIETVLVGLLAAGAACWSAVQARSTRRRRMAAWLEAARACGLEDVRVSTFLGFPEELSGHRGRFDVEIHSHNRGKYRRGTRLKVRGIDAVSELRLKAQSRGGQMLLKAVGASDVEVGDDDFDGRFMVQGPPALALAVLDESTRQAVTRTMGGETRVTGAPRWTREETDAELTGGLLEVDIHERSAGLLPLDIHERSARELEMHLTGGLKKVLDLAERLAPRVDVPRRLARNAVRDSIWAVRLANLKALHREYPDLAETTTALRASVRDENEEVRLYAAEALGEEGRMALLELAFGPATDEVAARAIAGLRQHVPAARALEALDNALSGGRLETACACIDSLARASPAPEPGVAEPRLVGALSREEGRVRLAAALALGRLGDAGAVLPLREAGERFGGDLRAAARQAVAEIQARLTGATPGQLSLPAEEAGHVSLADSQSGEVSLPPEGAD